MFDRLPSLDAEWNWFALELAVKGTVLLLLGAGVAMLLCRSSAAVRHRVWSLSFTGLLILPLVQVWEPGLRWHIIPESWQTGPAAIAEPQVTKDADLTDRVGPLPIERTPAAGATGVVEAGELAPMHNDERDSVKFDDFALVSDQAAVAPSLVQEMANPVAKESSTSWLAITWQIGIVLTVLPLLTGLLGNIRLRHCSLRFGDSPWQQLAADLSDRLGLRRSVTILNGGPEQMPITFGFVRPCVVLPSSAVQWSHDRQRIVLLHELAHVKRCDVPLQLIARLAATVYWFHPLVWWALRRLRLEREHACDDCVLQAGQEAPAYATQLLEIARAHRSRPMLNAALSMARRSQLEGRLLAVLDLHRRRNGISRAAAIQLTAATVVIVVCIGLVRPTLQAELSPATNDANASATADDYSKPATQMILTGNVLSPEGKPVPKANVEVIAYDYNYSPGQKDSDFELYQTRTDANGSFRFILPRNISRPREYTQVIAAADGYAPNTQRIESTLARNHVELKLHAPRAVRLQLIDAAGNPISTVQPRLWRALGNDVELFLYNQGGRMGVFAWPEFSKSDAQGYVSVTLPAATNTLELWVADKQLGDHLLRVEVADKPTSVALKPPQFLRGNVTAADTGEPIAGAEVVLMQGPFPRVRTESDGRFQFAIGASFRSPYPYPDARSIIHVYPPPGSPYLAESGKWERPKDGFGDGELSVALKRGVVVVGRVIEKRSRKPIAGAAVLFEPQKSNNPLFRESIGSSLAVTDIRFMTDADGGFRMPVWPGTGYLLVRGPTLDYLQQEISTGDRYYGKPGLGREYHNAAMRLNVDPGKSPKPLTIELERGVTLRRRVVRPDGQPGAGRAYARSYLLHNDDIHSWLPPIPFEQGVLEIPGFEPERSKPILIVDPEARCATIVAPAAAEIDLSSAPIELQPCGAARFRFVMDNGSALSNYEPRLLLIVTPGARNKLLIEPDQPLWAETIIWQNIARPAKILKTDSDGHVTVDNLIPEATYRISFINTEGDFDEGHEFTVRSGETVDVGKVIIPERDQ